ncbi:MAG: type II toxin-antitoxin system VapC family toxin [Nitrospirae bacterium]|nr:type II toxin-antitoxin system VapC family toxin [Magnetococcales bacterium]HAT50462.1 hypothetical protein [Alphaproteobacteria bacterium]
MKNLIVDASVACKWYLPEEDRDLAKGLLIGGISLLAPELLFAEVGNVLWKWLRRGTVDPGEMNHIHWHLTRSLHRIVPLSDLFVPALRMAAAINHPIYDCFYLALAERENAPLVTADERLISRLTGTSWESLVIPLARWEPTL